MQNFDRDINLLSFIGSMKYFCIIFNTIHFILLYKIVDPPPSKLCIINITRTVVLQLI